MDELLMTAAMALVSKATDTLTAGGLKALESLRQAVKAKFSRHPSYSRALEHAEEHADEEAPVRSLAQSLALAADDDPIFAALLDALVPQITVTQVDQSTNVSLSTGPVSGGISIQTAFGTVHGNATNVTHLPPTSGQS